MYSKENKLLIRSSIQYIADNYAKVAKNVVQKKKLTKSNIRNMKTNMSQKYENHLKFSIPSGIKLLYWPPYSPDLNIMKSIWGFLSKMFKNIRNLELKIEEAVSSFNQTQSMQVNNLYKSMMIILEKHAQRLKYQCRYFIGPRRKCMDNYSMKQLKIQIFVFLNIYSMTKKNAPLIKFHFFTLK